MHRTETSNVLVIGTGAAGCRAAIAATQAGVQVLMLGKRARLDAHTVMASGGINAALGTRDPDDSWEQHFADTVREATSLATRGWSRSWRVSRPTPMPRLAAWGCVFARTGDGRLDQRFFGAHRWRRTCYAGDFTGRAILRTVAVEGRPVRHPASKEDQYVSRLLAGRRDVLRRAGLQPALRANGRSILADAVILGNGRSHPHLATELVSPRRELRRRHDAWRLTRAAG